MDSQAYLNQISAKGGSRKSSNGPLSSKVVKLGLIGAGALVLILVVGMLLGGSGDTLKNKIIFLKLHTTNLSSTLGTYQSKLKSSNLRSSTAQLRTILDSTASSLSERIKAAYKITDSKEIDKAVTKKENTLSQQLKDDLFNAQINGLLDRTFASKVAYEITVVTSREKELIKLTKNAEFKEMLESSLKSINNLYNNFNNYSEAR